jgi:8-amino-3,8-dideoxy-alpha-D-manno-octulosonate transaminase
MIGAACDLDRLRQITDERGLLLIEDAAQAFGGTYRGRCLGTYGRLGTYSFNIFKTINAGDGGAVATSDEALYRRAFAYHDQGHFPLRTGVEVSERSVIGQNYRMTELTAAVLLAQLRKLDRLLARLRSLKERFRDLIQDLPGLEFRRFNDPDGECATILTLFFQDSDSAEAVAKRLGTVTVSRSGWHVYNNMEQILDMRTANPRLNPLSSPYYQGSVSYEKGMLPQTDDLLGRAVNLSVGVVDAGLGSGFGITINSTGDQVNRAADKVRQAVREVLGGG